MNRPVIIVGAGQAGLAIGYYLQSAQVDYVILDGSDRVGSSWSKRWDSLRLFTSAQHSGLPGSPFPSTDQRAHPSKDDVSRYLENYVQAHRLNVRLNSPVTRIRHDGDSFLVSVRGRTERANQVVIATGPFSAPWVPPSAASLNARIQQVHSAQYRNPAQITGREIVIVGGGNSGFQIALELANAGKRVHLSERTRSRALPQRMLGRPLFWWLNRTGILTAKPNSLIGRSLKQTEPIIGTSRRQLRKAGVMLRPGALGAIGDTLTLADGAVVRPDTVIWATGYVTNDRWIDVPAAHDKTHNLVTDSGVTPMPGLFTIGRHWQRNRGSSLLGFVGEDARQLSAVIAEEWRRTAIQSTPIQPAGTKSHRQEQQDQVMEARRVLQP